MSRLPAPSSQPLALLGDSLLWTGLVGKGSLFCTSESFPIKSKQSVSEGVKNTSRPEGQSAAAVTAPAPPVLRCQCL